MIDTGFVDSTQVRGVIIIYSFIFTASEVEKV